MSTSLGNADLDRPWGGRLLSAAAIVLVALAAFGWSATHSTGACGCGPSIHFGAEQPGFRHVGGGVGLARARLPVRIHIAPEIGTPAGVYRSGRFARLRYDQRSLDGVFLFTAERRPPGFSARAVRDLSRECDVCSDNRLVALAPGVHGALLSGGNGPNSVTWLEHGLEMQVLGPATTFSSTRAVNAARALARANQA